MKLSNKPRHYAPRKKSVSGKNHPGHRSKGGVTLFSGDHAFGSFFGMASILNLIFAKKPLVARRVPKASKASA